MGTFFTALQCWRFGVTIAVKPEEDSSIYGYNPRLLRVTASLRTGSEEQEPQPVLLRFLRSSSLVNQSEQAHCETSRFSPPLCPLGARNLQREAAPFRLLDAANIRTRKSTRSAKVMPLLHPQSSPQLTAVYFGSCYTGHSHSGCIILWTRNPDEYS